METIKVNVVFSTFLHSANRLQEEVHAYKYFIMMMMMIKMKLKDPVREEEVTAVKFLAADKACLAIF